MKVWLWDEIGGEWTDVDSPRLDTSDHKKLHDSINTEFDMSGDGDRIIYRIGAEGLSFNIGYFGEHNHLFIEMWGNKADGVAAVLQAERGPDGEGWYTGSPRNALRMITEAHATAQRSQGD